MGIPRRLLWAIIVLPLVLVWFVEMLTRWILTGDEAPATAFDPWLDKARKVVLGKED